MGLTKWITKKGITGTVAREVGNRYRMIHESLPGLNPHQVASIVTTLYVKHKSINPQFTIHEIANEAVELRHTQGDDATPNVNLYLLVDGLVSMAQKQTQPKANEIIVLEYEVISEELAKLGVPKIVYEYARDLTTRFRFD